MNLEYENDYEQTNGKRQWTTMKNAPISNNRTDQYILDLKKERTDRFLLTEKEKAISAIELIKEANKRNFRNIVKNPRKIAKENARKYYKMRKENKPKTLPLGTLSKENNLNLNQRLTIYSKHHKCECKLKFNKIHFNGTQYKTSCNHKNSTIKERNVDFSCNHCGNKKGDGYKVDICGCKYILCERCKFSNYNYEDSNGRKYYQLYDKHSAAQLMVVTTPMATRNEIPEPEDIRDGLLNNDKYVIDLNKEIKDKIKTKRQSVVNRLNFYRDLKQLEPLNYKEVVTFNSKLNPEADEFIPKIEKLTIKEEENSEEEKKIKEDRTEKYDFSKCIVQKRIPQRLRKMKLKEEDSKEQGGTGSKVSGWFSKDKKEEKNQSTEVRETKNFFNNLISRFKKYKQELIEKQFVEAINENKYVKEIKSFFKICIYVLKVLRDTVNVTNILLIFDLLKDFKKTGIGALMTGMRIVHLYSVLCKEEEESFKMFTKNYEIAQNLTSPNAAELLYRESFGSLTTIIRKYLIDEGYVYKDHEDGLINYKFTKRSRSNKIEDRITILKVGFFNSFNPLVDIDTPKTGKEKLDEMFEEKYKQREKIKEELSNPQSMDFSFLVKIIEKIPSSFSDGLKMFTGFCKQIIPVLSVIKLTADIGKILERAFDNFIDWWYGRFRNPKEWLANRMISPGNPINDLQCIYMLYRAKVVSPTVNSQIDAGQLRQKYYDFKVAAESYATSEGQYSSCFTQYLRSHEEGLQQVGIPSERPYEPTVLVLFGQPGSGKSTMWPIIVAKALGLDTAQDPVAAVKAVTYTWKTSSEYQTGMVGKRVVLFDDFGQDKSKNTEALELIHLVTAAPYSVNSANITGNEIKGMFTSPEIIIICTNDPDFNSEKIYDARAIKRRLDIVIEPTKKFDVNNLDEKILNLRECKRHRSLVGNSFSVAEITGLFTLTDTLIKYEYQELRKEVGTGIKNLQGIKDLYASMTPANPIQAQTFRVKDHAFDQDLIKYNKIIEENKKKPKIDQNKLIRKAVDNYSNKKDFSYHDAVEEQEYEPIILKKLMEADKTLIKESKTQTLDQARALIDTIDQVDSNPQSGFLSMLETLMNEMRESFIDGVFWTSSLTVILAWGYFAKDIVEESDFTKLYCKRFLRKALKTAILTAGGCALIFIILKYLTPDEEQSGTSKTPKAHQKTLVTHESSQQSNMQFDNLLFRSIGTIQNEDRTIVNCMFIGGTYILTVKHFFLSPGTSELLREGMEIKITKSTWQNMIVPFKFEKSRLINLEGGYDIIDGKTIREDVVLYELDPKLFNSERKIWHHFWNAEYSVKNMPVAKYDYLTKTIYGTDDRCIISDGIVVEDQITTKRVRDKDVYWHIAAKATYTPRSSGCGSPVIRTNTQENPILGVHIAVVNSDNTSLFHFVTRDMIEKALNNKEVIFVEEKSVEQYALSTEILPEGSVLEYIGKVKPAYQNEKTELTKSTIHSLFGESVSEPAPLSYKDERLKKRADYEYVKDNFYKILFEGFKQEIKFVENDIIEAFEYLVNKNKHIKVNSFVPQRPLTLHEALNGFPYLPQNTKVDLTTSPGYPYTIEGIKRSDLIIVENDVLYPSKRLEKDYYSALNKIKNGIVPFTPYTVTIKDERIHKSKIYDKLKPRLFMNGNIVNLLLMRTFFYSHVMAHYHSNQTYSAVRLDRLSLDWEHMIKYLAEVGQQGFDKDYKFWDRSICKLLSYKATELELEYIKNHIIEEIGELGYKTLLEYDSSPYYVFRDILMRAKGTMPSGEYTTYMKNCDINELLHISAYLSITRKNTPLISNMLSYNKYNRGKRGGDDTIQTVSDTINHIFNGNTYAEWINSKGMHCTSSDKKDIDEPLKPLHELSFLKNTTGKLNGHYVPRTDLTSVYEMMYWVRLNKHNQDIHKATQDNCNAALRCIYFYGHEMYNEIRRKILDKHPNYELLSYGENNTIWSNYFYFPGSHSDYATRQDQDVERMIYAVDKYAEHRDAPEEMKLINTNYNEISDGEWEEQSGQDKATINMEAEHPNVAFEPSEIQGTITRNTPDTMVDSMDKERTKQTGTTIQESERTINMVPTTGKISINSFNKRAEAHCNDNNWTLKDLEEKYTMVKQFTWSISDVSGTLLQNLQIPNDILITPAQKTPFDVTALWRAKSVKMRVIIKGSDFYSGTLVSGFYPSMQFMSSDLNAADMSTIIQLGGSIQHISDNASVEYEIPFRHYYGFLEAPIDLLGQFQIYVLNPLRTGPDNANDVLVTVYASILDSEFKIPEFVPPAFYTSNKFGSVRSTPQAGTTERMATGQININDHICNMKPVMLCAGKGIVTEPKIKQFQDHPVDLVQLEKRYRLIDGFVIDINAGDTHQELLNFFDIRTKVSHWLQNMFQLYRGSINLKIIMYTISTRIPISQNYEEAIQGRVYLVMNQVGTIQNLRDLELAGNYYGGCHLFDSKHPAQFMIPYFSPVFTSTYDISPTDPFATEQKTIVLNIENNSADNVSIVLEILGCVGDDFSTGVFIGSPSEYIKQIPSEESTQQSGEEDFMTNDKVPGGRHGTLGEPIKILSSASAEDRIKTKPLSVIEIIKKAMKKNYLTKRQERVLGKFFIDFEGHIDSQVEKKLREKFDIDRFIEEAIIKDEDSTPQAGIIEFIDKALDTTLPIVENLDELANLLDAHPVTYQPYPIQQNKMGYTIPTDIVQYVERLLTTNHNGMSLTDKEAYGTGQKETDMYKLMTEVKSITNRFTWNTSQTPGTLLYSTRIGPSFATPYKCSPPMDVFSTQFNFWNGSIIYIIDIAATKMHKGQLTMTFHPNLDNPPTTLEEATQQYFVTFDLTDGRATTSIQVPYLQKRAYLPINNATQNAYGVSNSYNGIVCLWVQNALRATNVVSSTVDVNIYKAAGKDFKLEAYGNQMSNLPITI